MKIWLASFPRSGNTFMRNLLLNCYGIKSDEWHKETAYGVQPDYANYDVVKTHLLPVELIPDDPNIPAVYIVRDGRDAMVSIAHHKKDLVQIGTDFTDNLREAIIAAEGSYFGGWSGNVKAWMDRAQVIIRYEDLLKDPIACCERLRPFLDMPQPDMSKFPTFENLKAGKGRYGSTDLKPNMKKQGINFSERFFRKGIHGGWRDDMTEFYHDLFWNYHGEVMDRLGYTYEGELKDVDPVYEKRWANKIHPVSPPDLPKKRVLIEATKITGKGTDGIKRYTVELLNMFNQMNPDISDAFSIDILIQDKVCPLEQLPVYVDLVINLKLNAGRVHFGYENVLLAFRAAIKKILPEKIYDQLAPYYRNSPVRIWLFDLKKAVAGKRYSEGVHELGEKSDPLKEYDLIHVTLPQNYGHFAKGTYPMLFTVHDISHRHYPGFHEYQNTQLSEEGMQYLINKNAHVIAISASTKEDINKEYRIPESNIDIVYEAANSDLFRLNVNPHFASLVKAKHGIAELPYFLCLSTLEPRKNLVNTIKAFNLMLEQNSDLKMQLVIVGEKGWKYDEIFGHINNDDDHIVFTGFVDDKELHALYTDANAFCYVSHYEGFGLPILEAMRCRTPVIYGNNSSQPEVAGEGGVGVDADDIVGIANAMKRFASDADFREEKARLAWKQSFHFSWRKTAVQTLEIYRKLCR